MTSKLRIVLDTNILVSRMIARSSVPAKAFDHAFKACRLLTSEATSEELREVVRRPKFDRFDGLAERIRFAERVLESCEVIRITVHVTDCVDAKDNKFLELALSGRADIILTGDDHLLRLRPWRNIPILTPREFLDLPA